MNDASPTTLGLSDLWKTFRERPLLWIVPTVAVTLLAVTASFLRQPKWEASQALVVRDEVSTDGEGKGKFRGPEEMQLTQETLLEIVASRSVLEGALRDVGPEANTTSSGVWPTDDDIDSLRDAVSLSPPKGAEFGKTEVFYLKAESSSRERAVKLCSAILQNLQNKLKGLRADKAASIIDELSETVAVAEADLHQSTEQLAAFEAEVGVDLSELRILHESPSGQSDLRQGLIQVEDEIRAAEQVVRTHRELLSVIRNAQQDAGHLLAAPNELLESQPALRRLKDGLVDAKLQTAQLSGLMSENHPRLRAAIVAEQEISRHLHDELDVAVRGVETELRMSTNHLAMLNERKEGMYDRMEKLAVMRATYGNLVSDVEERTRSVELAKRNLAEARGMAASVQHASLITGIDEPFAGSEPAGPGKALIWLVGIAGGFVGGLGVVFLTTDPTIPVAGTAATKRSVVRHQSTVAVERSGASDRGRILSLSQALSRMQAGS